MELCDIVAIQADFDRQHGWDTASVSDETILDALERELVGLMGEVGEVANLIKKARLSTRKVCGQGVAFKEVEAGVREELTDVFIYLLRMHQLAHSDIEQEYKRKLDFNRRRFQEYLNGAD